MSFYRQFFPCKDIKFLTAIPISVTRKTQSLMWTPGYVPVVSINRQLYSTERVCLIYFLFSFSRKNH